MSVRTASWELFGKMPRCSCGGGMANLFGTNTDWRGSSRGDAQYGRHDWIPSSSTSDRGCGKRPTESLNSTVPQPCFLRRGPNTVSRSITSQQATWLHDRARRAARRIIRCRSMKLVSRCRVPVGGSSFLPGRGLCASACTYCPIPVYEHRHLCEALT
jgi:hypothetical protein